MRGKNYLTPFIFLSFIIKEKNGAIYNYCYTSDINNERLSPVNENNTFFAVTLFNKSL